MSEFLKEFIVTLKDRNDLDQFYQDIENYGSSGHVPERTVECSNRRMLSRNTHYLLTLEEAEKIKQDPRVEAVTLRAKEVQIELHSSQTATFHRGDTPAVGQKNWALYRCGLDSNVSGWGDGANVSQDTTINLTGSGKNVDVVIIDDIAYPDHAEYADRFNQFDWFSLDQTVRGTGSEIATVTRSSGTVVITTVTPHGLSAGAIVNVVSSSHPSVNATGVAITLPTVESGTYPIANTFRYTQAGTEVTQVAATGHWVGVYQYDNYSGNNNHATHVTGIIGGNTQGWARDAQLYNLRHDTGGFNPGSYTPSAYLIDYVRAWHAQKNINAITGKVNPTIVNCSWGMGVDIYSINNPYTGGLYPAVSKITYRGSTLRPEDLLGGPVEDIVANTPHNTAFAGIYGTTAAPATLTGSLSVYQAGNRITTSSSSIANIASLTLNMGGRTGLTDQGLPFASSVNGVDAYDDAVWRVAPPWNVTYLGGDYGPTGGGGQYLYVNSNGGVQFGGAPYTGIDIGASGPPYRKIFVCGGDRSCQRFYSGTEGVAPNRTHRIRWEGHDAPTGGLVNSPTILWEMTFYEATPNQIDLHVDQNSCFRGEFTATQLAYYGISQEGPKVPYRDATVDADISDAIDDGIIFVASAGNNYFKIDTPAGTDYNNSYVLNGTTYYYHRGATPAASHPEMICVGSVGASAGEYKQQSSNAGPRVDLYAPGQFIMSTVYNNLGDSGGVANTTAVNSGQASLAISFIARSGSNVATITTSAAHDLVTGDIVTVACITDSSVNTYSTAITVNAYNTFTYANTGSLLTSTAATGTITVGNLYQKYNGTSMSAAQVTGILTTVLETYPSMTQAQARAYIKRYAKSDKMTVSTGGYGDFSSLQGGDNKFLFYYKERPESGNTYPKINYQLRPASGMVFPRNRIRRY